MRQFLMDLYSGKLHREFHYGPDPEEEKVRGVLQFSLSSLLHNVVAYQRSLVLLVLSRIGPTSMLSLLRFANVVLTLVLLILSMLS